MVCRLLLFLFSYLFPQFLQLFTLGFETCRLESRLEPPERLWANTRGGPLELTASALRTAAAFRRRVGCRATKFVCYVLLTDSPREVGDSETASGSVGLVARRACHPDFSFSRPESVIANLTLSRTPGLDFFRNRPTASRSSTGALLPMEIPASAFSSYGVAQPRWTRASMNTSRSVELGGIHLKGISEIIRTPSQIWPIGMCQCRFTVGRILPESSPATAVVARACAAAPRPDVARLLIQSFVRLLWFTHNVGPGPQDVRLATP